MKVLSFWIVKKQVGAAQVLVLRPKLVLLLLTLGNFVFLLVGCNAVEAARVTVEVALGLETPTATVTPSYTPTSTSMPATGTPVAFIILPRVANVTTASPLLPTPIPSPTSLPTPTPIYTRLLQPTLTPIATVAKESCPARFGCVLLQPTKTLTPTPTATVILPTPYLEIKREPLVGLYTGPGETYPQIAQLAPTIRLPVNGRNTENTWWRVVVDGDEVWLQNSEQVLITPTESIDVYAKTVLYDFSPTAEPTFTPTATPPPFDRAAGPEPFPSTNDRITLWVKIYIGLPGNEQALPGYQVHVEFQADNALAFTSWPNGNGWDRSLDQFSVGSAGVFYNYKYEITPVQKGTWQLWLTDSGGLPLSPISTFETDPANSQREFYIAWIRSR